MKKKLLYINNFEAPYRVPFFNLLGEVYDMTLALSQKPEERKERNVKWFVDHERTYQVVYLSSTCFLGKKIAFEIKDMLNQYDLVFMDMYANPTNMYAIWCLNHMHKPFFLSVDGMLPHVRESKLLFFVKRFLLNCPLIILSPGHTVDDCLIHYGVHKERIRRYHFTSLTEKDIEKAAKDYDKQTIRERVGIQESVVILTVGQFVKRKGFDILLEAAKNFNTSVGFYFVGGEATEEYLTIVDKNRLKNIHFIGFKSKEELSEYYRAADVFCLPTREDIWGLVINEAMSYGLPIITTNRCVAGLELVDNGISGYIIPTENAVILSEKINKLIEEPQLRKEMSEASRNRIQDWTLENMANEHIEILK